MDEEVSHVESVPTVLLPVVPGHPLFANRAGKRAKKQKTIIAKKNPENPGIYLDFFISP
ncbi:MAG: hypothetical protein ACMUIM_04835 [bacterium]